MSPLKPHDVRDVQGGGGGLDWTPMTPREARSSPLIEVVFPARLNAACGNRVAGSRAMGARSGVKERVKNRVQLTQISIVITLFRLI